MYEIDISVVDGSIIGDTITFNPIQAGKETTRTIFINNKIDYELDVVISLSGDITKEITTLIAPNDKSKLDLIFNPSKNSTRPIQVQVKLRLDYIVT